MDHTRVFLAVSEMLESHNNLQLLCKAGTVQRFLALFFDERRS